jgi:hypothetical protein
MLHARTMATTCAPIAEAEAVVAAARAISDLTVPGQGVLDRVHA